MTSFLAAEIPTRAEFLHQVPLAKAFFYLLMLGSMAYATNVFWQRRKLWNQGKPITWRTNWLRNILVYILAQKKVRSSRPKSGAPMHLLIFFGFMALLLATTLLGINTYSPFKFHHGMYYLVYEATFDTLGLLLLFGLLWAIGRRTGFRPKVLSHEWRDNWALILLLTLTVTGYLVEAGRIAVERKPWDSWSWVGSAIASLMPQLSAPVYVGIWWFHTLLVATFICTLPHMKLKHIVMAIATSVKAPDWPMGQLQPLTMEEVEATGKIGAETAPDYTRWHLMSLDACMECGRCTEVCPANGVGKILNPKEIAQGVREALATNAPVAQTLSEEAIWACTTCNACVEACPVLIRHVDLIVDVRRNLVAEGKLSGSAATMLRQTGSTMNAWGATPESREEWMKGRDIPLARDKKEFDVLFWVGCAGATDPGAVKTTQATAELMQKAGVNYACLGREELCTGDSARRVGDEFMFQELTNMNIGTFNQYRFKTIVTPCPHCFNTLANEYPAFGGKFEVLHHTQFLQQLIAEGKLVPASNESMTYHDPCYLGRVNDEQAAPRSLIGRMDLLREPEHRGKKTLCCGAGGGRMWMEEAPDQRPGVKRAEELLATGAKTVALGCPFCKIMLDASIKQVTDEEIRLVDLAEMMAESNR